MYGKKRKSLFGSGHYSDSTNRASTDNSNITEENAGSMQTEENMKNKTEEKIEEKNVEKTEIKSEGNYSLYTEKIVVKPSVKYRKAISFSKLIASGALFGLTACVVFSLGYPWLSQLFGYEQPGSNRPSLTIPKDEYPTEDENAEESDAINMSGNESSSDFGQDDYITLYSGLRQTMVATKDCMVTVNSYNSSIDEFINEGITGIETAGIVVGEIDSEYVIITNYEDILKSGHVKVKFNDKTEVPAYIINSDAETGIAMICVKQSDLTAYTKSTVKIAQLDNSYMVSQGDIVIAAGRLFGNVGSVNYGVATNVKETESGLDSCYGIINTSMSKDTEDYGFLFNISGNVIGIMKNDSKDNTTFNAYGISDLKSIIEEMSNGSGIIYFGVVGQNVTTAISHQYNLPTGVFISEVVNGSPAFEAGLQSGDVITKINGEVVLTFQSFSEKLYNCDIGDTIIVTVKRLGKDEYKDIEFPVVLRMK